MFYDSKLFAPNYYNNRAHPLGRFGCIVLAWSIVALAHCVCPKKRDALFCGCSPCHRAIITAPLHSKRRSVLYVCAFPWWGAERGRVPSRSPGGSHFPEMVGCKEHNKPLLTPLQTPSLRSLYFYRGHPQRGCPSVKEAHSVPALVRVLSVSLS